MSAISKPKLRKLRREKRLEKLLRKEKDLKDLKELKENKEKRENANTYRRLLTTFSCNVREAVTKVRMLITETKAKHTTKTKNIINSDSQYYVVTVCDDFGEVYAVYYDSNHEFKEEPTKVEDRAQSFVLELPPDITTDEQAIAWAKYNMRGHYKKLEREALKNSGLGNLNIEEKQIEENINYFYRTLKEYKKLKRKNLISARRSSYPSAKYCWNPKPLCTTPDGVCVFAPEGRNHYSRRAIIRKNYNDNKNNNDRDDNKSDDVKNYLGLDDEALFGYGSLVNESIKEIFLRESNIEEEIWDLETCQELNISDCCTMTVIDAENAAGRKVTNELIPHANEEVRKILQDRDYYRYCSFFTDEIIFDKYKRALNNEQYSTGWNCWQSTWKLIVVILSNCNLPLAVIETIIKKYLQPLRVTEDDLRKIRVERWLRNLSSNSDC